MQTSVIEDNVEIITTYERFFESRKTRGAGYSFPCDASGNVEINSMQPNAIENYNMCLTRTDYVDRGVQTYTHEYRLCPCGSGEYPADLYDARGIYCCKVCDKCREEKMARYRPEIFEDSDYEADEPIEPDDY